MYIFNKKSNHKFAVDEKANKEATTVTFNTTDKLAYNTELGTNCSGLSIITTDLSSKINELRVDMDTLSRKASEESNLLAAVRLDMARNNKTVWELQDNFKFLTDNTQKMREDLENYMSLQLKSTIITQLYIEKELLLAEMDNIKSQRVLEAYIELPWYKKLFWSKAKKQEFEAEVGNQVVDEYKERLSKITEKLKIKTTKEENNGENNNGK